MYSFIPRDEKWVGKVMMMMMVAHLRMIKDKVREQDQIEACTRRTCVWHWQQRVEEESSAYHGGAGRFRDLLDIDLPRAEDQLLTLIASLEACRTDPT